MNLNDYINGLKLSDQEKKELMKKIEHVNRVKGIMYKNHIAVGFINRIDKILNVDEIENLTDNEIEDTILKNFS